LLVPPEEFGDGIMIVIDLTMGLTREPDPKGDASTS